MQFRGLFVDQLAIQPQRVPLASRNRAMRGDQEARQDDKEPCQDPQGFLRFIQAAQYKALFTFRGPVIIINIFTSVYRPTYFSLPPLPL